MSPSFDTADASPELFKVLRWLSRRGAYLERHRHDPGAELRYRLVSPGRRQTASRKSVAGALVRHGRSRGWLEQCGDQLKLSRAGALELRQNKSAAGAPSDGGAPGYVAKDLPATLDRPGCNDAESPLAWLRKRKDKTGRPMLSQAEFDAGERLRADFWFAQMTPRVTADWSPDRAIRRGRRSAPRDAAEMSDAIIAARKRVRDALSAVGPELSGILIDVCCHLRGLSEVERAVGWPLRSAKVVLAMALSALARHYGLVSSAAEEGGRIRRWGAHDYRPSISDEIV